jgi:malate dehydrogenase (oxaloacetate-decarboxylating)
MAADPIVFPMANPTPEITPELARAGGAAVIGTGRSDFPNQINNALAFPGVFRGALDARASDINEAMKISAARAIADFVTDDELSADYIIPSPLNRDVAMAVASAVKDAAIASGLSAIAGTILLD